MSAVKVSPKFQIVIPKDIRDTLSLQAGETLEMFVIEGRIEILRIPPIRKLKGFLKGMDPTITRDEDRV